MEILGSQEAGSEKPQREPDTCDWCDANLPDIEVDEGVLKIRLHEVSVLNETTAGSNFPVRAEQKRDGDYVKVKVRCVECGHVNVVVGYRPPSSGMPFV
jgi:hypothetical protein